MHFSFVAMNFQVNMIAFLVYDALERSVDVYDTKKNKRKRAELVRSYFLDDPSQVVPVLMEMNKKYWEYEWIFQWNTGIMESWMMMEMCVHRNSCKPNWDVLCMITLLFRGAMIFLGTPMLKDVPEKKAQEESRVNSDLKIDERRVVESNSAKYVGLEC